MQNQWKLNANLALPLLSGYVLKTQERLDEIIFFQTEDEFPPPPPERGSNDNSLNDSNSTTQSNVTSECSEAECDREPLVKSRGIFNVKTQSCFETCVNNSHSNILYN